MVRNQIKELVKKAVKDSFGIETEEIRIEKPKEKNFGDYSTNIALIIAEKIKKEPKELGKILILNLKKLDLKEFERIELAGPGFINFFLSKNYLQNGIREVLRRGEKFGQLEIGQGKKVNLEFISANPTGPLTLGNGRGGFCGDTLSRVLEKAGFRVKREYYINDKGEQIKKLGHSILGDSQALYRGKYIDDLRKRIKGKTPEEVGEKAAKIILEEMIVPSVKRMGIRFDVWFSEKSLYDKGEIEKILNWLKKKKLTEEREGALWFKSVQFGDDKDRVLVTKNGEKTYFASDIAYFKNKFKRGFDYLIYFWGADHSGYIKRMEGAVRALGYKKEQAKFIIFQLVCLFEKGKQIRMSKREGTYVTLDELIDEVGLDVARFFFLQRSPGSHLNFDLDLAKLEGEKNPVYYIQYAHARISSILRKLKIKNEKSCFTSRQVKFKPENLNLLNHQSEFELIKQILRLPEIIEDTAEDYQVQRLSQYSKELATLFHQFYRDCKVISDKKGLTEARIALILAAKIVLNNTLDLMGISAPEKM